MEPFTACTRPPPACAAGCMMGPRRRPWAPSPQPPTPGPRLPTASHAVLQRGVLRTGEGIPERWCIIEPRRRVRSAMNTMAALHAAAAVSIVLAVLLAPAAAKLDLDEPGSRWLDTTEGISLFALDQGDPTNGDGPGLKQWGRAIAVGRAARHCQSAPLTRLVFQQSRRQRGERAGCMEG